VPSCNALVTRLVDTEEHGVRVDTEGRPGEGRSYVSGHPVLTSNAK
jgi:hypothetical protein